MDYPVDHLDELGDLLHLLQGNDQQRRAGQILAHIRGDYRRLHDLIENADRLIVMSKQAVEALRARETPAVAASLEGARRATVRSRNAFLADTQPIDVPRINPGYDGGMTATAIEPQKIPLSEQDKSKPPLLSGTKVSGAALAEEDSLDGSELDTEEIEAQALDDEDLDDAELDDEDFDDLDDEDLDDEDFD